MKTRKVRALMLVVMASAVITSCGDVTTAPVRANAPAVSVPAYSYGVSERLNLVTTARSRGGAAIMRRVIDQRGGWLWSDDVYLYVPPGALRTPTEITLTLPAGDALEVELEPHGLRFDKPVMLAFNLRDTKVDPRHAATELLGAYYVSPASLGSVDAEEVSSVFRFGSMAAFNIMHFSSHALVIKGLILVGG